MSTFKRLNASCVLVVTGLLTAALGCFGQAMEPHSSSVGVISGGDASRETPAVGTTSDRVGRDILAIYGRNEIRTMSGMRAMMHACLDWFAMSFSPPGRVSTS
jgi:hypothetical protein